MYWYPQALFMAEQACRRHVFFVLEKTRLFYKYVCIGILSNKIEQCCLVLQISSLLIAQLTRTAMAHRRHRGAWGARTVRATAAGPGGGGRGGG